MSLGVLNSLNRYISRANARDNTRHVILSTASMRPTDFAAQLNVSLANGWGIVRTVTDMCMKMPEGKYVLVKDPNKVRRLRMFPCFSDVYIICQPVIRLYSVPLGTFTVDEEDVEAQEETFEEDE